VRVYDGGLYKLEPKELMNISLDNILSNDLIDIMQKTTPAIAFFSEKIV
jgi:hypothetical protein